MKRKKVLLLFSGLAVLGILASVAMASGGGTRPRAPSQTSTKIVGYKYAPGHAAARAHSGVSRLASIKVLGYKHTPGQAAAARAAQARSYIRQAARIRVDAALVKNFHLLRQARKNTVARTASTSSESTVAAAISGLVELGATFGANPSLAGETTVGPAKDDVWLVPGSSGACLVDVEGPQGAGSGCNSTSAVDAGDLWTIDTIPYGLGGERIQVLLGAVPDGNASVTVSWADGGTTVVPVTDNIYGAPIGSHRGWESVTLKNSAGAVVAARGMPTLP